MAYQAAKRMNLGGQKLNPGDTIDQDILIAMPHGRVDSLRRVGHIVEVIDTPEPSKRKRKRALESDQVEEAAEASPEDGDVESPAEDEVAVDSDPVAST